MKETGDIRNQSIVPPDPALVLESLRSIGYSLETAVADIIDNSISAGARHIHFDTVSDGEYIMISDDGRGMSESELINALKLGSADPLEDRNVSDLQNQQIHRFPSDSGILMSYENPENGYFWNPTFPTIPVLRKNLAVLNTGRLFTGNILTDLLKITKT